MTRVIPMSVKYTLILLVVSVGLPASRLMSMFTDMANVSAIGLWNKQKLVFAAVGYLDLNFEIGGAGRDFQNTSDIKMCISQTPVSYHYFHIDTLRKGFTSVCRDCPVQQMGCATCSHGVQAPYVETFLLYHLGMSHAHQSETENICLLCMTFEQPSQTTIHQPALSDPHARTGKHPNVTSIVKILPKAS